MNKPTKRENRNETGRLDLGSLLPHDDLSRKIMQERASILSRVDRDTTFEKEGYVSYIKFVIGVDEQYGIPFDEMLDVKLANNITKVPMAPSYVVGISYWHGKLIPVIDIGMYLSFSKSDDQKKAKYIAAIESGKTVVGIIFDDVIGVDQYYPEMLDKNILINPKVKETHVYGIHNGKTTILNVKNILQVISSDLMVNSGGAHEKSE